MTHRYTILFPIDFSNRCLSAARHVNAWVRSFHAVLHVAHTVDAKALGYPSQQNDEFLYNKIQELLEKREADLKFFSDHYFGEGAARCTVLSGSTAEQIESFCQERDCTEHAEAMSEPSISSILCAVHFESDVTLDAQDYRILQNVSDVAAAFQARVTVLHVLDRHEDAVATPSTDLQIISGAEPWMTRRGRYWQAPRSFLRDQVK